MSDNEEPVAYGPIAFITEDGDATTPLRENRKKPGRKPKVAEVRKRELRLTPPDGKAIEEWHVGDPECGISKLIACEEGGTGTDKALHYHAVVETTYTDDALKGWIRRVLRLTPFIALGNKVYRTGEFHENSYGYCVKNKQVKIAYGYSDAEVQQLIEASEAYRKDVMKQRKALQTLRSQGREKQLKTIEQIVLTRLNNKIETYRHLGRVPNWGAEEIVEMLLAECDANTIDFPTRNQMEAMVNRLRWRTNIGRDQVVSYYSRSLSYTPNFRQEYT